MVWASVPEPSNSFEKKSQRKERGAKSLHTYVYTHNEVRSRQLRKGFCLIRSVSWDRIFVILELLHQPENLTGSPIAATSLALQGKRILLLLPFRFSAFTLTLYMLFPKEASVVMACLLQDK